MTLLDQQIITILGKFLVENVDDIIHNRIETLVLLTMFIRRGVLVLILICNFKFIDAYYGRDL